MAAFLVGLIAIGWVGHGHVGVNPLALTMTALIGAFYLTGALELRRFQQATSTLGAALAAIPEPLPNLGAWLAAVPASLQNAVRLRIEGERVGLPGPALTPYLVGLLVLLGMLGTFLGMVVTLNGAVLALESTTDLPTIRAALAAPVKGLGLAFGTSVAGVAASAMLGLISALCRRERLQAAQLLDTRIATSLRPYSLAHQRQETLETLRAQSRVMPAVVDQLHTLMQQMERQSQHLSEQLLAGQDRFHQGARSTYSELAASVDRSLKDSLTESARVAGATIQPLVEAAMRGIAQETGVFQERMADTVQAQLDGLSTRFAATVTTVAEVWTGALARHERSSSDLSSGLQQSLERFNGSFDQRSAALLSAVAGTHASLQGELKATLSALTQETTQAHERMAGTVQAQLDGVSERFASTVGTVADTWRDALTQHRHGNADLSAGLQKSLATLVQSFDEKAAALLASVDRAQSAVQAERVASDQQRLSAWVQSLEALAASLQREWQQAGANTLSQQEQICRTLEQTARDIHAQAQAHAGSTISEIARLVEAASEAPRAAAEVIDQLRQKLTDSMTRDNDLLEERSRIMGTLNALLDAVNQAATEQRGAIDSLVSSSAALLQHVGTQFNDQVEAESAKMTAVATQITGSAVEVASMGDAFGHAVQLFSASSAALTASLQRIEASLDKSTARSDDQLAYYVAQAREIIDLSISSQQQIVDDLRQLSTRPLPVAGEVA